MRGVTEAIQNQGGNITPLFYGRGVKEFVAFFNLPELLCARHYNKIINKTDITVSFVKHMV